MLALHNHLFVSSRLILSLLALFLAQSVHGAEPDAANSIRIAFSGETFHASGITPGGEAIVFVCTVGRSGGMRRLGRRAEVVSDVDRDGEIALAVGNASLASLWTVVDFTTGRSAVATPSGFEPEAIELHDQGWRGGGDHFELRRRHVEVLVVRPGEGAWMASPVEGGPNDGDGALNAILRTKLTSMRRMHGSDEAPRPPVVIPKDVLVVVDPRSFAFFVSEAK